MDQGLPPDEPAAGSRRPLRSNGAGFVNSRDDPRQLAAMREMAGAEGLERWQRSSELRQRPRPLTDIERSVLREVVAPLLADLAASGMSVPDIREEAHEERAAASVCAWIQRPGPTGEGIWILLDSSPAQQVAELAEQFQNWAADRLHDAVRDGAAVWACPESGQVIGAIGALGRPGSGAGEK